MPSRVGHLIASPFIAFAILWIIGGAIANPTFYAATVAAGLIAAAITLPVACRDYRQALSGRLRANARRLRSDADYQHDAWLRGASIGMYGRWTPLVDFERQP